ncbi:ADP-ribosylation factor 4-like [Cydia fagiglandana]|uniref:ADP-ribosylation factor 4-like n=1 Tax=Cydia fagiglandana TaxID=1458189 RepID=UPI002FEDF95A
MANFFSNLYANIFGHSPKSPIRILILGLNGGVGKTTVLYRLKDGTTINSYHTTGYNFETVTRNNISYEMFDIGGGDKLIPLWKHYFQSTKAIIFVVDSTDKERLNVVEQELHRLLTDTELEHCPLLVLANKQDLPDSVSVDELKKALKLDQWKNRTIHVQSAVANQGTGVTEGFDWLCAELAKSEK